MAVKLALGVLGGIVLTYQACGPGFEVQVLTENSQDSNGLGDGLSSISIVSPASNFETRGALSIKGTCISGIVVSVSGPFSGERREVPCTAGEFSADVTLSSGDGLKLIVAEQTNSKGSKASDSRSFLLDTTQPAIDFITPAPSSYTRGQLTITGFCENGLPVRVAAESSSQEVNCDQGLFNAATTLSGNDGSIEITVAQTDRAGNSLLRSRMVTKDTRPPVLTIGSPARDAVVTSPVSIAGTCESSLDISISGGGIASPMTIACSQSNDFTALINLSPGAGVKALSFTQTDLAGNVTTITHSVERNDLAPVIRISAPNAGTSARTQIALQGTCQTGLAINISGSGAASPGTATCTAGAFSANVPLSSGDGTKTISVSQTGANGLIGTDSRSFVRDTIAPSLSIAAPAAGTSTQNTILLSGACETGVNVLASGSGAQSGSIACLNGMFSTSLTLSTGDGTKAVDLSQTDAAGNTTSVSRSFVRDTAAPVVTITAPAANALVDATANLSGACETGINVIAAGTGITAPASFSCANSAFSGQVAFTAGTGTKTVEVSQTDLAGNRTSVTRSFMRNTEGPAINITAPTSGTYFQNTLTLQGTCTNDLPIALSGQGYSSPAAATCTNGTFSVVVSFTTGDGAKTVIASQVDALNRTGASSRSFNRDNTAPVLAITSPASSSVLQDSVALQGSCETGLSVSIAGTGVAAPGSVTCTNGAFSANVTLSSGDGTKVINISQTDQAGNTGTNSRSFVRDTTAPALTISSPAAGSTFSTTLSLQGACETGLAVNLTGAGAAQAMSQTCTAGAYNLNVTLSAGDGAKAIRVTQTDSAGNVTNVDRSFVRDSTAPMPRILMPAQGTSAGNGLTISGSCESARPVVISGTGVAASTSVTCTNSAFSSAIVFSSGDGAKTVNISQSDLAGNVGTDMRSFLRDSIAPSVTIASPGVNTSAQNGVQVAGVCESGIAVVIWGTGILSNTNATCTSGMYTQLISFSAGDGAKEIRVSQTDSAGNVTSVSRIFLRDTMAPAIQITSPAQGTAAETGLTLAGSCENGVAISLTGSGLASALNVPCTSNAFSAQIQFSSGDGDKLVSASQTDAAGNRGVVSRMFVRFTAPTGLDGAQLYTQNCAACHGALASSTKLGRDAPAIRWAITNIPQMGAINLTDAQLTAIASALAVDSGDVDSSGGRLTFACDANLRSKTPLLKLVNREFRVALVDILNSIDPNLRNNTTLTELLNGLPLDTVRDHSTMKEQPLLITRDISNRYFEVAYHAGTLVASSSVLGNYLGSNTCLASSTLTETCHRSFIQTLASRAFRRTVSSTEAQQLSTQFWDSTLPKNQQLIMTFAAITQMPDFLYKPFDRGTLVAGTTNTYNMTSEELAAKLSFFLVGTPPDSELRSLGQSGALNDPQVLSQQFDRLIARPEARATITRFFRETLGYEIASDLNYPDFFRSGISTTGLAQAMTDEMDQFFTQVALTQRGSYRDLHTARVANVSNSSLAAIYGVSPGTALTLPSERAGYLNRAAFLTKRSGVRASPIKRGLAVLENTLCVDVGPAPPSAPPALPDLGTEILSTREVTHRTTEVAGTSCVGCHSKINPLGYAFEGFDSFGRVRTQESIFDSSFNLIARVPVNTAAASSELGAQSQSYNDSVDLSSQLGQSDRAMMCFVKNLKKFESRIEPTTADNCQMNQALQTLYGSGTTQGSIVEALKRMVTSQQFRTWSH